MERVVYRIEDKNGNGLFCYKNGQSKTYSDLKFNDEGLYAFNNISDFYSDSYINFLLNPEYILYKIIIRGKPIYDSLHEIVFREEDIISKTPMLTPC